MRFFLTWLACFAGCLTVAFCLNHIPDSVSRWLSHNSGYILGAIWAACGSAVIACMIVSVQDYAR